MDHLRSPDPAAVCPPEPIPTSSSPKRRITAAAMEEDKGAALFTSASSGRDSSSSAVSAPAATSAPLPPPKEASAAAASQRQRFTVELMSGETTIVSWNKLLKDPNKGAGPSSDPAGADPALAPGAATSNAAIQPVEGEPKDAVPPPNRFSAVIEKIERLYTGKESSDEEGLGDNPDDDEYDTDDSFIDDAELDEYFEVNKLATKHNGYFVNKGKLEQIESSPSPNQEPKKRKRKDPAKTYGEKDSKHISSEPVNMGNMRIKAAARSAALTEKKLLTSKILTPYGKHYQDGKHLKNKSDPLPGTYKKNSVDVTTNLENPSSVKILNTDAPPISLESKELDKHKTGVILSRDITHKPRGKNESFDGMHQDSRDKDVPSKVEPQPKKFSNGGNDMEISTKIRHKERNGIGELPDLNSSGKVYPMATSQQSLMRVKEGSIVRPKGTTLERSIRDLEKIVAESRPQNLDVQEIDASSQVIKRRLPQDIKQKLAKVARLSASQGKISEDELMVRLMGILGHLVQRKTLKRHMKEMVELGYSAKRQKADRFQQIKKEVHEMIKTHVSVMRSKVSEQDGSADDFQEAISNDEKRAIKGKYNMGKALEDKICDLYDLYVEGMDEDKGPQSRKLYVQLAELWPNGYMDNLGIKDAVYRSKERKRSRYRRFKVPDEERLKKRRLASSIRVEESAMVAQVRAGQERQATKSAGQVYVSPHQLMSNQPLISSGRSADQAPLRDSGYHHGSKPYDKPRGGTISASTAQEDGGKAVAADVKRKTKRKSDSDMGELYGLPQKLPTQQAKEKSNSHKQSVESNLSPYPPPSIPRPVLPATNTAS